MDTFSYIRYSENIVIKANYLSSFYKHVFKNHIRGVGQKKVPTAPLIQNPAEGYKMENHTYMDSEYKNQSTYSKNNFHTKCSIQL